MQESDTSKKRGIPANAIMMPIGISLLVLLVFIVLLIFETNRSSNELADLLEDFGTYQQETMDLSTGINTLSETANSYLQAPVSEDGSPNIGPLMAFVEEFERDRRGPQIAQRFHNYSVSDEVRGYIEHAAETSETMLGVQTHVIALVRSVYPLPENPRLSAIPDVALTEEELAMPAEARLGLAGQLIQNQEYAQLRHAISEDTNNCIHALREEFSTASDNIRYHVKTLRTVLWVVVFCIVALLVLTFLLLRTWVVWPLGKNAAEIAADDRMTQLSGIREMRVLVDAYNALLNRRNKLESILRSAAETDALTGLPNRYSMEHSVLDASDGDSSMAVLMFDVNYLKEVNDTQGHQAGDQLLRTAGACICECFATKENDNCYRLGGDEFAAVLKACDEAEVKERIDRFYLTLKREGISVSVGYAYARTTDEESFKLLLEKADRQMYEQKQHFHEDAHYVR